MRSTSIFQCQLQIGGWNLEVGSYKGPIPWGQPPTSNWGLEFGSWRLEVKNGFMYHEVNFHLPMSNSNFQLEVGTWRLEVKNEYMFYEINFHLDIFQYQLPTSNWRLEFGGWKLKRNIVLPWCQLPTSNWRLDMKKEYRFPEVNLQLPMSTSNWRLEVGS